MGDLHISGRRWQILHFILTVALCSVAAVYVLRLFELQVLRGRELRDFADQNRFFTRNLPAPRGIFFDRTGTPLVRNTSVYKRATPETASSAYPTFEPIDERIALASLVHDEKNVYLDQQRTYPYGPALSSVLGYIGEVTQEDLARHPEWFIGESVGKLGLERVLQNALAGTWGKEVFEMDAKGNILRSIYTEKPIAGYDTTLTIDASLSAKAYELLAGKRGAVVASDPRTGEVLVLVSSPSFDPTKLAEAVKDEASPMLNRATNGTYPPGSTFKLMTALAGLIKGVVKEDTLVDDEGELLVGGSTFGNWYFRQYGRKEGELNIVRALQRSNDIFFYKTAEWTGAEDIARMARVFHLGAPTGIELYSESAGLIPDPQWKESSLGEKWYLGDTYHMGIGQGDVSVTPIQLNQMTAALANGGVWCIPHLLKTTKKQCTDLDIDLTALRLVLDGMKAACASGGTAFPFFDGKPVITACKTGTSEVGAKDEQGRRKTHGWLTVMAPADNPEIVVTVLVESNEDVQFQEGSRDAGPIAKALLMEWFGKKK